MKPYPLAIAAMAALFFLPKLAAANDATFEQVEALKKDASFSIGDKDVQGRTTCDFTQIKVDPSLVVTIPKNTVVEVLNRAIVTPSGNIVLWTIRDTPTGAREKVCLYFRAGLSTGVRIAADARVVADKEIPPADVAVAIPNSALTQTQPITANEWGLLIANCSPDDPSIDMLGKLAGDVRIVLSVAFAHKN